MYRAVVRDDISAAEGSTKLRAIIDAPPLYGYTVMLALAFAQGFLLCGVLFGGNLIEMSVSGLLSTFVSIAQAYAAQGELSASGAECVHFSQCRSSTD